MKDYQLEYSKINPSLYETDTRIVKAKKIFKIIHDYSNVDFEKFYFLEVGCSTGININYFGDYAKMCIGIDIDHQALQFARSHAKQNVHYLSGDGMHLPFKDEFFDVIICNHVYEHVPDSTALMKEIYRVLKSGGFCYFAAGNKYSLIEGHYHLPFLSWLPRPLANSYLRLTRKGSTYYEKHLSYRNLKKLVEKFALTDYTIKILDEPDRFGAEDLINSDSIIRKIPAPVFGLLKPLIPTYIFILSKE